MSQNIRDPFESNRSLPPLFRDFGNIEILNELAAIRQEIKELKEALNPPKSIIITGPDVERILRNL